MKMEFVRGPAKLVVGGCANAPTPAPQIQGSAHIVGADLPGAPKSVPPPREGFPLLATAGASSEGCMLADWARATRALLDEKLEDSGAVLLQGLPLATAADFSAFMAELGYEPMDYQGGAAARHEVAPNVMTANDAGPDRSIPMHTEMAYSTTFPRRLFFFCEGAPGVGMGGETPIARTEDWRRELGDDFIERTRARGFSRRVTYPDTSSDPDAMQHGWRRHFQTEDRAEAEAVCRRRGFSYCWEDNGDLTMWNELSVTMEHGGVQYWACMPQFSAPASSTRYCYGDGSPIEDEVMQRFRTLQWKIAVAFQWSRGDVLCIDNITCQHGRLPFEPAADRRILAALTGCTTRPPVQPRPG